MVSLKQGTAGEEFGMERLSAAVRSGSSLSAEDLMSSIYNAAADFCGDDFNDDVTILVVKCDFDGSRLLVRRTPLSVAFGPTSLPLTASHIRVIFDIAFYPEKHLVSASAIVQCAGHFSPRLAPNFRPILIKLSVFNDFRALEPLSNWQSGLHCLVPRQEKKDCLRKNTCENFDVSELHLICRYTTLR